MLEIHLNSLCTVFVALKTYLKKKYLKFKYHLKYLKKNVEYIKCSVHRK